MRLTGLGIALATPFKADFSVDFDALGRLIDHVIAGGADYIVALATTSEAVTLDCDERHRVARFVADRVQGRVPLVIGMSSNSTMELARHLGEVDLSGYSAILSVVPFYNKPSQEGIFRHFAAVAEASPLPVVLYNVPSRTGRNMEAATTLRLAHRYPGRIIGIKEASGIPEQTAAIVAGKPQDFQVVSGDDALTLRLVRLGAEGVISVVGNALPALFGELVHRALANPADPRCEEIQRRLEPLDKALFMECNPSGIKHLLAIMGMCEDVLRLPLVPVGKEAQAAISAALAGLAK